MGAPCANKMLARRLPKTLARGVRCFAGLPDIPLLAHTWAGAVEQFDQTTCVTFDGMGPQVDLSFGEMESRANRLARRLQIDFGVGPGSTVVTISQNRPELMTLFLACVKTGAIYVPLASDLMEAHTQVMVRSYDPQVVITDKVGLSFPREDGSNYSTILMKGFHEDSDGGLQALETDRSVSDQPVEITANKLDCGLVFSTSGSTGNPKGVMYSQNTIGAIGQFMPLSRQMGSPLFASIKAGHSQLLWAPMRGVVGTTLTVMLMTQGVRSVMVDTYPNGPNEWTHLIKKHEIQQMTLFGAAMNELNQQLPDHTFESVLDVSFGGSCFPPSLVLKAMQQFPNATFAQSYGMTEIMPISVLTAEHHVRGTTDPKLLHRMSSAGKVSDITKLWIEDMCREGSGQGPPPEKQGVGQICAANPLMMMGYWKDKDKTAAAVPDGFMRTGDVGRIDEDGFLHILDRMKDIIPTYRGYNIAPKDIEELLYQHPDVGQAAVVGIAHPSGAGDMVVAWCSPKKGCTLDATKLREHCIESELPEFQMPDAFELIDAIPTNGGKVAKKLLRAPSFVRQNLANNLFASIKQAKQSGWQAEATLLFERIDADVSGYLDQQELSAVVGLQAAEGLLSLVDSNLDARVDLSEWMVLLGALPELERSQTMSTIGSTLASFERKGL